MADDQKKALDEKTRKLSSGKIEEGKEHSSYQESQQQLLAIQAEQKQNLAVARAESKASFENNQILAQAAELGAASAVEAEQAALSVAAAAPQLNPATQAVLNKYGMGQPRFQRTQSHNQQVTKQNITINNNTTVNTTNDVKVPANIGGPLQGRPLQFKTPASPGGASNSIGKFKSWISSTFARQNEEGAKRDREYRNRENSLTRSASRMMKKLEDIGKTIGSRMDPRKIGSTWQSQLKTLLFLFGFGYLTSNWTNILEKVSRIEKWFKEDFADFFGFGSNKNEDLGLVRVIKHAFGAKEGESLLDSFKSFFGKEGLFGLIEAYFDKFISERSRAIKMVKFPEINLDDLVGTIKGLGSYIGDLLTAMVSGSEGVKSHIEGQIRSTANKGALEQAEKDSATRSTKKILTTSGKHLNVDSGTSAITENKYKGLTRHSLDSEGNLTSKYGAESTVAQASDINRIFSQANEGGKISSTELSAGLERLFKAAKKSEGNKENGVPVHEKFIKQWFTDSEITNMFKTGEIKNQPYYVVARKKTDEDNLLEDTDFTSRFSKEYTEKKVGDLVRNATETEDTFLGDLYKNYQITKVIGKTARTLYNKSTDNDYRIEYVRTPREGDEVIDDGNGKPKRITLIEIKPSVVQKLADKITGKEGSNIDITDREFVTSVQKGLVESAKNYLKKEIDIREKYRKEHPTDINNNTRLVGLRNRRSELLTTDASKIDYDVDEKYKQLSELIEFEKEQDKKFEEYKESNRAVQGLNYVTNKERITGTERNKKEKVSASNLNGKLLKDRVNYSMKFFMEKGLSKGAAAGIVGNLVQEGLGKEDLGKEYHDGSGPSAGIAAFHSYYDGRKGELDFLKDWAKRNNKNWKTLDAQLEYLWERNTQKGTNVYKKSERSKSVMDLIKESSSGKSDSEAARDSSRVWAMNYERFKEFNQDTKHSRNEYKRRASLSLGVLKEYDPNSKVSSVDFDGYTGNQEAQKTKIALIGDSYAVGMSSYFKKEISNRGAIGKCEVGKRTGNYAINGATVETVTTKCLPNARSDGNSIIVIHAGLRNFSDDEDKLYMNLANLGQYAKEKAKVFFIAPITSQTSKTLNSITSKRVSTIIKSVCSDLGFGIIDLGPSSDGYEMKTDGVTPTDFSKMAKEVVDLLFKDGGVAKEVQNSLEDYNSNYGGKEESDNSPQSFLSILMDNVKKMIFNFGSGFVSKTENLGQVISETGDKIVDGFKKVFKGEVKPYEGPITSEFTNYESYKKLPDEIPEGLTNEEWKDYVYRSVGAFPKDIRNIVNPDAEKIRQEKIKKEPKKSGLTTNQYNITSYIPPINIESPEISVPYLPETNPQQTEEEKSKEEGTYVQQPIILETEESQKSKPGPITVAEMTDEQKKDLWKNNYKNWMSSNTSNITKEGETTVVSNANETLTSSTIENPITNLFSKLITGTDIEPKPQDSNETLKLLNTITNNTGRSVEISKIGVQTDANIVDAISAASANIANALAASRAYNRETKPNRETRSDITGEIIGDINITT